MASNDRSSGLVSFEKIFFKSKNTFGIIEKLSNNQFQGQANKWIKNLEQNNNLGVIKLTDSNYDRVVESAIQYGYPVILENILEDIDPALGKFFNFFF